MRIGFKTSQTNVDWPTLRETWELGDTLPVFDSAWIFDHFVALGDDGGGSHEGMVLAGALAILTRRLQFGHLVLGNTYRHPAVVANMDPFHAGQADTVATCSIDLDDFGGAGIAVLTDTCSYPSMQPNSDPSDCVITPTGKDPCEGVNCADTNPCTVDVCDSSSGSGVCLHRPGGAGLLCRPAAGVCDVPEQILGLSNHVPVTIAVCQHQGAVQRGFRTPEVSLRVPQYRRSRERSQFGSGKQRRQAQNPFIPLEAFGGMPPNQPEVLQPPRDRGHFARASALDEPRQYAPVILEIITHAIQPFALRRPHQSLLRA